MKHLKTLVLTISIGLFTGLGFAQTLAASATAQASTGTPSKGTAAVAAQAAEPVDMDALSKTANELRTQVEDLCRDLRVAEKDPTAKGSESLKQAKARLAAISAKCSAGSGVAHGTASAGAKVSATASAAVGASAAALKPASSENGKLVFILCDGSVSSVVPTVEVGTRVEMLGVCGTVVASVVIDDRRIVTGATAAATPVAAASAAATASAQVASASAVSASIDDQPLLWHEPTATAASPRPCVISAQGEAMGLPDYCSTFKVVARNSGETKAKWLVRVGGGVRPTDTGVYTKPS